MAGYPYNPVGDAFGGIGRKLRRGLGGSTGGEDAISEAGQESPMSQATKSFLGIPDSTAKPMQKRLDVYNPYGEPGAVASPPSAPAVNTASLGNRAERAVGASSPDLQPALSSVRAPAARPQIFKPDLQPALSSGNAQPGKQLGAILPGFVSSGERIMPPLQDRTGTVAAQPGPAPGQSSTLPGIDSSKREGLPTSRKSGVAPMHFRAPLDMSTGGAPRLDSEKIEVPKYKGVESGLGWKTRLGIYKEDMDAYNKATGNQTAMDIEQMRESGAGSRAQMAAKVQTDQNNLSVRGQDIQNQQFGEQQERLGALDELDIQGKQGALDDASIMREARNTLLKNPNDPKARSTWNALNGKTDQKFQVIEQPGVGPDGYTPTKTPYILDSEGNARPAVQADPISILRKDPEAFAAYNKLSPEEQKVKLQQMQDRLRGSM